MKNVEIRPVWQHNLECEFALIQSMILYYPFLSIDTEFPGTVFQYSDIHAPLPTPASKYKLMKANVDNTNIIQLGLTLSDNNGNLPSFGTNSRYIWEFNFRDFDVHRDLQNISSIQLLKKQGIDFLENKEKGIRSSDFSLLWHKSSLFSKKSRLTWVTFHSAYDFGYLIKILTHNRLPQDINNFMCMMDIYFGKKVYDIKSMIRVSRGIYGGLERVANKLGVDRVAGKSHQATSDSLLTWQTFQKLTHLYYASMLGEDNCSLDLRDLDWSQRVLYGLDVEAY